MLPARFQPALVAAERALGRLDAALADPAGRRCHAADARHRAARAALHLDGLAVADDDLRLIEAAPEAVAPGARADAALGAALLGWIAKINGGPAIGGTVNTGLVDTPVSLALPQPGSLAADGLRAALEGLALLAREEDIDTKNVPTPSPVSTPDLWMGQTPAPPPWTQPWAMAALVGWAEVHGRPGPSAEAAPAVSAGLETVARTLAAAPGLEGALRVVAQLHQRADPPWIRRGRDDPFENPLARHLRQEAQARTAAGFWSTLARLGAPALLRQACGLTHAELPLVVSLATAPAVFRATLAAPEEETVGWLLDRVAQQADAERERLALLERRAGARRTVLQGRRRDAGAWALIDRLEEEPAVTVRQTAWRLGCSGRAARTTLGVLTDAGVLRPLPAWRETGKEARRTADRPVVWLMIESLVERPPKIKPARQRSGTALPPAGTPMHWLPIATAPQDGKRCLVWAGRPALASFTAPVAGAPLAWREGRRVLQPTHWLPLAPPPQDTGKG